jgi:hypothetical protein
MTHPAQCPLSSLGGLRTPAPRARRATIMTVGRPLPVYPDQRTFV